MQKKLEFRKQRDFGQAISDTLLFARQNYKQLLKLFAIFCGFFVVAATFAMATQQVKMISVLNDGSIRNTGSFSLFSQFGWQYVVAIVFGMLSYTLLTIYVTCFIKLYVESDNTAPTIEQVWGYTRYYFLRVFLSSILLSLMLLIGFLLCLIPGFWLFPIISIFYPIMIIENGNLEYSFSRMFKLIKGEWWNTFLILFVMYVVVFATSKFFELPFTILNFTKIFGPDKKFSATYSVLTVVVQYACQVFLILPVICSSICYYSLVEKKESPGLLDKIQQFGEKQEPLHNSPEEY